MLKSFWPIDYNATNFISDFTPAPSGQLNVKHLTSIRTIECEPWLWNSFYFVSFCFFFFLKNLNEFLKFLAISFYFIQQENINKLFEYNCMSAHSTSGKIQIKHFSFIIFLEFKKNKKQEKEEKEVKTMRKRTLTKRPNDKFAAKFGKVASSHCSSFIHHDRRPRHP